MSIPTNKAIHSVTYNGVAVPIEGGGGSLPSSITKIDGGSFTLASDTLIGNYDITHTLGEAPKGFALWSENAGGTYSVYTVKNASRIADNVVAYSYFTSDTTERLLANATFTGTTTTFKFARANIYYKANATYKWLAWA